MKKLANALGATMKRGENKTSQNGHRLPGVGSLKSTKLNAKSPVKQKRSGVKQKRNAFPIVAIGASAGGLDAMQELLKNLSPTTGMAFVFIQHLDPDHESMLSEILQKHTRMPVLEAQELLEVKCDHVYVIPPNKDMCIIDGVLKLTPRHPKPSPHLPINRFFLSLAEELGQGLVGIVLSGNGSDGSLGIRAIKNAGGLTFAQDDSAKFFSMPRSAIAEDAIDLILSPKEIGKELVRRAKLGDLRSEVIESAESEVPTMDKELATILHLVRLSTGTDFTHYKVSTIKRRVIRRMVLHRFERLKDYEKYLRKHTEELTLLFNDLLINVTSFFRDPEALEYVKKSVLPKILKAKLNGTPVRVWVAGCSSGMETYSIAILILELLGDNAKAIPVQLFATDLSDAALNKARMGIYSPSEVAKISPVRLKRFFTKLDDGNYRISKTVRDICVFASHDITKDPPFSHIDFISCCNLLIYLDTVLQKKILATFHYALNNGGSLLLGKSETTSASPTLFTQVQKQFRVYTKKNDLGPRVIYEMNHRLHASNGKKETFLTPKPIPGPKNEEDAIEETVDKLLLEKYAPACVLINKDMEIQLFRGATGLFLESPRGKATFHLVKMAREGLGFQLRNAVAKASASGQVVKRSRLQTTHNGVAHHTSFEVVPVSIRGAAYFLILFSSAPITEPRAEPSKDKRVKELQAELKMIQEDIRTIVESQEAANEELQSANEEVVSSNEELQSVNEELETSKEEIESSNEELITINQELQVRNEHLMEAQEYQEAIFQTLHEPVLVLDRDFRIRSANASFYSVFHMKVSDTQGTLLHELGNKQLNIPKLYELLTNVIMENVLVTNFEARYESQDHEERIMLLNARRVKVHNVSYILLAFEDVTERIRVQEIRAERDSWFRTMANNVPVMLWVAGPDRRRTFFNDRWFNFTGRKHDEEMGSMWKLSVHADDIERISQSFLTAFEDRMPYQEDFRLRRYDGTYRWMHDLALPTYDSKNRFTGYVGSAIDIQDEKQTIEELKKQIPLDSNDESSGGAS